MNTILGVTEADGFAFAMIAILGLSFCFVLVIFVGIIRQSRKGNSDADELIDEVGRDDQSQPAGDSSEKEKQEPWEKQADWWKNQS